MKPLAIVVAILLVVWLGFHLATPGKCGTCSV
jgi:hypothetical protein